MTTCSTKAYWVTRSGCGALLDARVSRQPAPGRSVIRTEFSGVSPGTERLVGLGLVPSDGSTGMACRYMEGDFRLPVKYGYALVGLGEAGGLAGRRVFVMHPHQALAEIEDRHATLLPADLPARRATLIPNLETALNAVWDGEVAPDERVVVVGGGPVGLLVAFVLSRLHPRAVVLVESDPDRRRFIETVPWIDRVLGPEDLLNGVHDAAFHTSGSPQGLDLALKSVGFEGRVIELSWYGEKKVTLDLGTDFHYQRKRIVASQVSAIAPSRRATHDHRQRLAEVVALAGDTRLDRLLGPPVPFESMPAFMRDLYRGNPVFPAPVIEYGNDRRRE